MEKENLTMLTDFYELSMGNGYFLQGVGDRVCYFDVFYRRVPEGGGYVIAAGLDSFIDYIQDLHFSEDDLAFLKKKGMDDRFLDYLRHFKFECDVWAVPEGTPIFPNEPFMTVRGPAIQAQFIETMTLLLLNHQSLIATKANRIVRAAQGRAVMEFGSRRAHGASAAILGGRAAYIGGCAGTACTVDEPMFGVPALGTMAHSWIQLFDSEYEAFYKYAELYPNNCTLLVDTYDVLRSGVPNAIKVFDELKPAKKGIRIDSGDIAYLTKESRKMLDAAGHQDCKITVSNSLDEYLIRDILLQGAFIDSLGVGERMITSSAEPVLGGVYKLMAVEENGEIVPRIKISENVEKVTNPGYKRVWRLRDRTTGKDFADVITVHDEDAPSGEAYPIVDLISAKHFKKIGNFEARELLVPIFRGGELVYDRPSLTEIRKTCEENVNSVWEEVLRFENPHRYYVDLSLKLWHLRSSMLEEYDR
jgi:nicotinate phosphoribosyltransferase